MFADRLKCLREQKGLTQRQMLDEIVNFLSKRNPNEKVQISLSTYRNWEQGVSIPNSKYLAVIAPLLQTTTDYLLGIKHEMTDYRKSKLMLIYDQLTPDGQQAVYDHAELLKASGKYNRPNTDTHIYTLGRAAAGSGYGNLDPVQTHRIIHTTEIPDHDFTLDVTGESMSPTISDGDIVFVRKNHDRMDGQIYVLDIDGETVIKRVKFNADKIALVSDNPDWPDRVVLGYELEQTRIEGIVVGWETPKL